MAEVRKLTPAETSVLKRRAADLEKARAAFTAAVQVFEDCRELMTGGDKSLRVDLKAGTLVRDDEVSDGGE